MIFCCSRVIHLSLSSRSASTPPFSLSNREFFHRMPTDIRNNTGFTTGFIWVSKVIRNCIGFASLYFLNDPRNLRHPLNQSDVNLKPNAAWSLTFSRALGSLFDFFFCVLIGSLGAFSFLLIGPRYNFGFGLTTLNRNALYSTTLSSWANW